MKTRPLGRVCLWFTFLVCGCERSPERTTPTTSPIPDAATASVDVRDGATCRLGADVLALPAALGKCDAVTCASANGACVWGGIGCDTVCARVTADEGKPCADRTDCQGVCTTSKSVPKGTGGAGTCSKTMVAMGCQNVVRKGVAVGYTCSD